MNKRLAYMQWKNHIVFMRSGIVILSIVEIFWHRLHKASVNHISLNALKLSWSPGEQASGTNFDNINWPGNICFWKWFPEYQPCCVYFSTSNKTPPAHQALWNIWGITLNQNEALISKYNKQKSRLLTPSEVYGPVVWAT